MADWDDEEIFENEDCYDEEGMNEDCYDEHGMPMNRGMHVEQIKEIFREEFGEMTNFISGFYSHESYPTAPTPGLSIHGVAVGFPLEKNTGIQLLKYRSDVDGKSMAFRNSLWNEWLSDEVLPKVCIDLGIHDLDRKRARLHLENLRVRTEGNFPTQHPYSYSPTQGATIAFVEIVLQSAFEGGWLTVRHDGREQIVRLAHNSEFQTNVVAWYAGSYCELAPIRSGVRIALLYDLVVGPPKLPFKPNFFPLPGPTDELDLAFQAFSNTKNWLGYLLTHNYSQPQIASFRLYSTLKDSDRFVVSNMCRTAAQYYFDVYIARLTAKCVQAISEPITNTIKIEDLALIAGPGQTQLTDEATLTENDFIQEGLFAGMDGDGGMVEFKRQEQVMRNYDCCETIRFYEFSAVILCPYPGYNRLSSTNLC